MQLRKMNGRGDEVLAEWTDTTDQETLDKIEKEFNDLVAKCYFAADITAGKEAEIIKDFNPKADILMLPRMQGGC